MLDNVLEWDEWLFRLINDYRSTFGDYFWGFISSHFCIAIIVSIATLYVMYIHHWKYWYLYALVIALCFLFADRISEMCFKDVFERLRPTWALKDVTSVKFSPFHYYYGYKGGHYGFVSSHCANIFSIITAIILILRYNRLITFKNKNSVQTYATESISYKSFVVFSSLIILWGCLTAYSRIYCGYHYPLDVICGTLLGVLVGIGVYWIYRWLYVVIKKRQKTNKKSI